MNGACQPRFVILEHDHPFLHWDLLIEDDVELQSWRLLLAPALKIWLPAQRLPPHRPLYLDYEGPVSGERGHVKRIEQGRFGRRFSLPSDDDEHRYSLQDCRFANFARFRRSHGHFTPQQLTCVASDNQPNGRSGNDLPVDGEWFFE